MRKIKLETRNKRIPERNPRKNMLPHAIQDKYFREKELKKKNKVKISDISSPSNTSEKISSTGKKERKTSQRGNTHTDLVKSTKNFMINVKVKENFKSQRTKKKKKNLQLLASSRFFSKISAG